LIDLADATNSTAFSFTAHLYKLSVKYVLLQPPAPNLELDVAVL